MSSIYRARATIANGSPSAWSDTYIYTNNDNIIAPVINGSNLYNSNSYSVYTEIEYYYNSGWRAYYSQIVNGHTSHVIPANSMSSVYRARFAQTGIGTSVTAWTT